ncbi:hypothetical protein [Anabaena sp. CS-542/02]|nr:hypothetical protein [Anabaena sp. CS-542/02]MDB9445478.1 hypothetical protein [Anabaena sp. CS-542/02]
MVLGDLRSLSVVEGNIKGAICLQQRFAIALKLILPNPWETNGL